MLLLPHHYEFAETLANLPFFYNEMASNTCDVLHLIQKDPNHLPEIANTNRLREFILSGETDELVEFVDGYANVDESSDEDNNNLLIPLIPWDISDVWLGSI